MAGNNFLHTICLLIIFNLLANEDYTDSSDCLFLVSVKIRRCLGSYSKHNSERCLLNVYKFLFYFGKCNVLTFFNIFL